jgi:hypothetical protein
MNDLVGLALVTELLDFFGCHLMAVDGSPDGKLAFDILVAVVGTVIGSWPDSYLTATLRTLANGGVQHHFSFNRGGQQRRKMFARLGTEAVKNLFLSCQEVLHLLFRDDPVTECATDEEIAVAVILLKEVLTGIALTSHLDTTSTDGATSFEVTGRKSQLYFAFLDDELPDEGFPFFVAHLKLTSLTCCQKRLYVFLGDVGSMILSEHNELTVVPRSVVILL